MNVTSRCVLMNNTRIMALKHNIITMKIVQNSCHQFSCQNVHMQHHLAKTCGSLTFYLKDLKGFTMNRQVSSLSAQDAEPGIIKRIFRKLGKLDYSRNRLKRGGFLLYEKCADEISFEEFRSLCNLPDTYFSWFLITEFHIWMCMARVMHEGEEGRQVRNAIVETLWQDTNARVKKLGNISSNKRKEQLDELYEQFIASLFLYDEGLQSNDKILAGAIWRRLLQSDCDSSKILESLVHYVRRQVLHLESISREDILINGKISWLPLLPHKYSTE